MRNPEQEVEEQQLEEGVGVEIIDDVSQSYEDVVEFFTDHDQKIVKQILEKAEINFEDNPDKWSRLLESVAAFFEDLKMGPDGFDEDEITNSLQGYLSEANELIVH